MIIAPPAALDAAIAQASTKRGLSLAKTQLLRAAEEFVTYDPEQIDMLRVAQMLADYKHSVLVLGETGTGKELVARVLHGNRDTIATMKNKGFRRECFYAVNCSGIPGELFESILFGHKQGSFTGAHSDEIGLLRAAYEGTAFLDEVGDLPLVQQTKLLRVLQTARVRPVGDTNEYPITCRFVFATNKDLKAMIARGQFREDLYYRISTFVLRTKPLRDRPDDVMPIARRIAQRENVAEPTTPPPVAVYAQGNVRALTNWLLRRELLGMDDEQAMKDL